MLVRRSALRSPPANANSASASPTTDRSGGCSTTHREAHPQSRANSAHPRPGRRADGGVAASAGPPTRRRPPVERGPYGMWHLPISSGTKPALPRKDRASGCSSGDLTLVYAKVGSLPTCRQRTDLRPFGAARVATSERCADPSDGPPRAAHRSLSGQRATHHGRRFRSARSTAVSQKRVAQCRRCRRRSDPQFLESRSALALRSADALCAESSDLAHDCFCHLGAVKADDAYGVARLDRAPVLPAAAEHRPRRRRQPPSPSGTTSCAAAGGPLDDSALRRRYNAARDAADTARCRSTISGTRSRRWRYVASIPATVQSLLGRSKITTTDPVTQPLAELAERDGLNLRSACRPERLETLIGGWTLMSTRVSELLLTLAAIDKLGAAPICPSPRSARCPGTVR